MRAGCVSFPILFCSGLTPAACHETKKSPPSACSTAIVVNSLQKSTFGRFVVVSAIGKCADWLGLRFAFHAAIKGQLLFASHLLNAHTDHLLAVEFALEQFLG